MTRRDWLLPKRTLCQRFWEKVDVRGEDDCWLWTGGTNGAYGYIHLGQKRVGAHRVSLMLTRRNPGPSRHAIHTCDTKLCVNPKHLYPGTRFDNARDMGERGQRCRGERHGRRKLTAAQVLEIRRLYPLQKGKWGATKSLAQRFGVSVGAIQNIAHRRKWTHLE